MRVDDASVSQTDSVAPSTTSDDPPAKGLRLEFRMVAGDSISESPTGHLIGPSQSPVCCARGGT
jgi:hypothetical protein